MRVTVILRILLFVSLAMLGRTDAVSKDSIVANASTLPSVPTTTPVSEIEKYALNDRIFHNYDRRIRPKGSYNDTTGKSPVIVGVNLYLRSISNIDDYKMEFTAQFTMREEWIDERLAYENISRQIPAFLILQPSRSGHYDQIWMPDTFFPKEINAKRHLVDKPNVLIRIYPDGRILYSVRLTLTFSCPMRLENYPLDKQTCSIDLISYAYTTDDIKYVWFRKDPVELLKGLNNSLPSFELAMVGTRYCSSKTSTGEYSCVSAFVRLKRQFSYYMIQLYVPSAMLVIVSWVSFWLDKDAVPARVSLGVTTLLTMSTQTNSINSNLPPVSYVKAIDVWIGACTAFIFGALLEFALVNYADSKFKKRAKLPRPPVSKKSKVTASKKAASRFSKANQYSFKRALIPAIKNTLITKDVCDQCTQLEYLNIRNKRYVFEDRCVESEAPNLLDRVQFWITHRRLTPKQIDIVSRFTFPITFVLFNGVYWSVYLRRE